MAEGWAKKYWSKDFDIYSAGTHKHGMNERAIRVMKEAGVDISSHFSKTTDELPKVKFDYIFTVCDNAKETCPFIPGGKIIHIGFQDPPAMTKEMKAEEEILAIYRKVRDEIEAAVKNLKAYLE
jgi:arsenate reductase (thioredoxin)